MDLKYDFLNGILEEEVYVDQPPGYTVKGHEDKVYKLKKGPIWSKTSSMSLVQ